jgi:hypothetical protein
MNEGTKEGSEEMLGDSVGWGPSTGERVGAYSVSIKVRELS